MITIEESERHTARVARGHYENFPVGSWLLPRAMRQHLYNVYGFCRGADDLGDEAGSREAALAGLDRWEEELEACYAGKPTHPVFIALRETVERFQVPREPFADLIEAFRMDQRQSRWESFQDLLFYCRHSANPVGRIFLFLFGYRDERRQELADATCTALQLANFWQDVAVDLGMGRVYLPQEDLRRFGVGVEDLRAGRANERVRTLVRFEVERTRSFFERGLGLLPLLDRRLALDVELFSRGGLRVLERIERQGCDVLRKRPALSKTEKALLFLKVWLRTAFR